MLVCPSDIVVGADSGQCGAAVSLPTPTTTGDCTGLTIQCAPTGFFKIGSTEVHCTAVDGEQKSVANCAFTVTVKDDQSPQISYPADLQRCTDPGEGTAKVEFSVDGHDNCGDVQVACSPSSGSRFSKGVTIVKCIATGASGDSMSISFTVTVSDCGAPEIHCPADLTRCADPGKCTAAVTYEVTGTAPVVCSPRSGSDFPIGATTVNCTAASTDGKTARCSFDVLVNDCEDPKITCPADITRCKDQGKQTAAVAYTVTATDACGSVNVVCAPTSGSEFAVGAHTVSCTATDAAGRVANCTFKVTVNDCEAPAVQITCPADITQCADAGKCTAAVTYQVTASPGAQVTCQPPSGSTFSKGTTAVSCTAAAAGGNQAQCSFKVTVTDCEAPKITCPGDMLKCVDPGKQTALVQFAVSAADNCGPVEVVCTPKPGSEFPKGVTVVTCSTGDAAARSATCSFNVTVQECAAPAVGCPANVTQCNDPGQCTAVVEYPVNTTGFASVVCEPEPGTAFPKGVTTVHCESTDGAGAKTSCSFTVTVNVCEPPQVAAVTATPSVLWPPNHKMVPVSLEVSTRNCEPAQCKIISVVSNEESRKGNGKGATEPWLITGDLGLELLAERKGNGSGRVYTVTVQCTDAAGHQSTSTVQVPVAHDHSKLSHSLRGKDLIISWDPTDTDSVLESTDDLQHPNWKPAPKPGKTEVVIPTTTGSKFYRLRQ